MEGEEEEEPPLAVEMCGAELPEDSGVTVGVTLITGYLGAGKSTVRIFAHFYPSLSASAVFGVSIPSGLSPLV